MLSRFCVIFLLVLPGAVYAKSFYAGDTGKKQILRVNDEGEVVWQLNKVKPGDFSVLDNGNILFCHSTTKGESFVREVTPDKKTVWE